jgi:alkaline phosphatase D
VRALLTTVLAALVVAAPAQAFELGIASGDVRPTSAVIWTRADRPGLVQLFYWQAATGQGSDFRRVTLRAGPARDLTIRVRLTGLRPATEYRYSFLQGTAVTRLGTFTTAPAPGSDVPVRFVWSGDSDGTLDPRTGRPAFGRFDVLGAALREKPDFFAYLGDTIYADSRIGKPATTLAAYRAKYRQNRKIEALRELERAVPLVVAWDDHEVRNDYDPESVPPSLLARGTQAFHEYQPVEPAPGKPMYRSFRWGRNLEIFVLDLRSYRSPSAQAACENPAGSGIPDVAPLLAQPLRDAFASAFAQLALPVPEACQTGLADPGRTIAGKAQLRWLERGLAGSDATWKVVLTPDPIQEFALLPYDRWEGYQADRRAILGFARDRGVRNVVWLASDTHATLVKDVLLDGEKTGMLEVVTGPIGTRTFAENVSAAAGPAVASLLGTFLTELGARCVEVDTFSYGVVEASAGKLVVDSRDARGRSVCGRSFTLVARGRI